MPADIFPKHMAYSICPGCATYEEVEKVREVQSKDGYGDAPQCAIKPYHRGKRCPCSECLVKMMCQEMCEELVNYKDRYLYGDDFTRPIPK